MKVPQWSREQLDEAFPTVVRYAGVVLAIILVLAGVFGQGNSTIASGGVLALGMILYKTVKGAANDDDGDTKNHDASATHEGSDAS